MYISIEWVFLTQDANPYDFNGNKGISYKHQIMVGDDTFKFKWSQEVFEKCKTIKKFSNVVLTCILKSSQNWGNFLQLTDITAKPN